MQCGYVYLLYSLKDKKSYLGSTDDLLRRQKEHQEGRVNSTRHRRPLKLIYTEKYNNLQEARARERYLKTRSGRRDLKRIYDSLVVG